MTARRSKTPKPKGRKQTPALRGRRSPAAELQKRLDRRTRELAAALQQQAATADVLKVISRSTFDLQAVLQTLLESAARLCEADLANIWRPRGTAYHLAASFGVPSKDQEQIKNAEYLGSIELKPGRGSMVGRVLLEKGTVQVDDAQKDPDYELSRIISIGDYRTMLGVPLLREGDPIGVIVLTRCTVRPFTNRQIELVTTFADQAVIAIENARLFDEVQAKTRDLEESLQQQTATSEVLQIISSSPGDLTPVFDKMLENATRVCGAEFGSMYLVEDDSVRQAALYNAPAALAAARTNKVFRPHPQGLMAAAIRTKQAIQFADIRTTAAYLERTPHAVELAELGGARTLVVVPMLREDEVIGAITIYRQEVRPFADKQIELVSDFAKQAVIAIENVRLLTETREALERQTATAEILQVINSSPGNLASVFKAMLEKATRLCGGRFGTVWLYDGERFTVAATHSVPAALAEFVREPVPASASASLVEIVPGQNLVHLPDLAATELYHAGDRVRRAYVDLGDARTLISVALRKDTAVLGAINVYRQEVRPFSDKEIALVQNFAAQAVIAMENARLLTETREALERQTATAEVLKVINSSPGDLVPVFETILEKAHSLCAVAQGSLLLYDGEKFRAGALRGLPEALAARLREGVVPGPNLPHRRLLEGARFAQVTNWAEIDDPLARASFDAGVRTTLYIPLRGEGKLLGCIGAARPEIRPFSEKEIALLESFAAQAVIAMGNARLLGELRERTADLARSVDEPTATSDVLKIISRSSVELETVLDTIAKTVARLCRAD